MSGGRRKSSLRAEKKTALKMLTCWCVAAAATGSSDDM